jgi:endonuclease YncB( thermonuclease family)
MASNQQIFSGLGLALLLSAGVVLADTLAGKVVGVSDGDTITVLDSGKQQHKIRVAGIDAPEKDQPFGQRSKENLARLVFGKEVDVQWVKYDRYQRIVGKVMVAEPNCQRADCNKTLDAGLGQVTAGFAWWYRKYAKEQSSEDARSYETAEQEARTRSVGLWRDADPVPPWDWRRKDR